MNRQTTALTVSEVQDWLAGNVPAGRLDLDRFRAELRLDPAGVPVLSGELENWLALELETGGRWYHPDIAELAGHLMAGRVGDGAAA